MLQRHVEILHSLGLLCQYVEKAVADVRRVGVHHPHPLNPIRVRQLAQQMRQRVRFVQVLAITRRILRDQDQFLHALFGKLVCFGDDRSKPATAKMTAHLRNKTEGTGTVAPFGNLDIGVLARRGEHARRRLVVEIGRALISERNHRQRTRVRLGIANAEDVRDLTGADESIDFGHFGFQLVPIAFDQTSGNHQTLRLALGLQSCRFQNRIDRFLLR